jgi:hypothetical protein
MHTNTPIHQYTNTIYTIYTPFLSMPAHLKERLGAKQVGVISYK